ncbi:CAP domain-containing protein [Strongyloides ratti]|uniref:CAP domain-containing protein n=1 Tax=Strongyloides ratti TaxID=34506 RepID=A0A090MWA0_STRRB|nr:CAP domain-containing protein [Strongyloides ratti]CEF63563.1 CAP domain-containing protein [Strongyloides ratti]
MKNLSKFLLRVLILTILSISSTISLLIDPEKNLDHNILIYYTADLKRVYVCNKYLFYNEAKALEYQNYLYLNFNKNTSTYKPPGGTKNKINKIKNKYMIGERSYGYFVAINPFSERFRERVWGDCGECYSKINISDFRNRVLEELNMYRKIHGVPSVSYDSKYNELAKSEAENFLKTHNSFICIRRTEYSCIYLELSNFDAHSMITSLYVKLMTYYNWKKNSYTPNLVNGVQLIWKKAKYIGLDFAIEGSFVTTFLIFSSKVTDDKNYKKNVFPVKSTYIKKYGTLP